MVGAAQGGGADEEAGEGLEQQPRPAPSGGLNPQATDPDPCKQDEGGIVDR
jgi:hypothetical protein